MKPEPPALYQRLDNFDTKLPDFYSPTIKNN